MLHFEANARRINPGRELVREQRIHRSGLRGSATREAATAPCPSQTLSGNYLHTYGKTALKAIFQPEAHPGGRSDGAFLSRVGKSEQPLHGGTTLNMNVGFA